MQTITRSSVTPTCQWWEINTDKHHVRALVSYDTTVALYIAEMDKPVIRARIASPSRTTGKHIGIAGCKEWEVVPHERMRGLFKEIGITLPCAGLKA
jgi:hypothetical protein